MAYLTNTSVNGDLGVSGLTSVGSAGIKFTSDKINIFGTTNSGGTGSSSISIGDGAAATGEHGVAIGYGAKASKTNGVAIGGADAYSFTAASGDHSIAIGGSTDSYPVQASGSYSIAIEGYKTQASGTKGIAIGYGATATTGTNIGGGNETAARLALGWGGTTKYYGQSSGTIATTSDERDKTDFKEISNALEFINKVKVYTYVSNNRTDYSTDGNITYDIEAHERGDKKGTRRRAGVKAQEVYALLKEIYNTDNYADIVDNSNYDNPDDEHFDRYFVRYETFIPFLIASIQEQDKKIKKLELIIDELKKSND